MSVSSPNSILIVGAGIAGLMAGRRLQQAGWQVVVVDKGRGLGGRMANRRINDARIDHGAQFFTVRDARFRRELKRWLVAGKARKWYDLAAIQENGDPSTRYIGVPAMTAIPKVLAEDLSLVRGQRVTELSFGDQEWRATCENGTVLTATWLLLTPPAPQSVQLLAGTIPPERLKVLKGITYEKCIAVMATLSGPSGLPTPGLLRPESPEPLALLVDNQQKGISPAPAITLHSGPRFAEQYFDAPDEEKARALLTAAKPFLSAVPLEVQAHRWGYAKPRTHFPEDHLYIPDSHLVFAGDAFGGGRVEGAALSGLAAANRLLNHSG